MALSQYVILGCAQVLEQIVVWISWMAPLKKAKKGSQSRQGAKEK
jgi:hypothetical protein